MARGRTTEDRKDSDKLAQLADWIAQREIAEVECIIPDMNAA